MRIVGEGIGRGPGIRRRQWIGEGRVGDLTDSLQSGRRRGRAIYRSGKCGGIGPDCHFQVVLRVLAAGDHGIPVDSVSRANDSFWIDRPGDSQARSPVVVYRLGSEEALAGEHDITEMRIGLESVWNTGSRARLTA